MTEKMYVSNDTAKFHRRELFEKLEVVNISEAIVYITNNKLI
jgi:DNA-binding NarL/FixJ family response regulator